MHQKNEQIKGVFAMSGLTRVIVRIVSFAVYVFFSCNAYAEYEAANNTNFVSRFVVEDAELQHTNCSTSVLRESVSEEDRANEYDIAHSGKPYDPVEKLNRIMFGMHKGIEHIILKPSAKVYTAVFPKFLRNMIHSGINNMLEPINIFNAALQGHSEQFASSLGRFIINSSIGVAGLFDVASEAGIERGNQSFARTLHHYKVPVGPYLFFPIIGPTSARNIIGYAVDYASVPTTYMTSSTSEAFTTLYTIDYYAQNEDVINDVHSISLDEYITIRSIFYQAQASYK